MLWHTQNMLYNSGVLFLVYVNSAFHLSGVGKSSTGLSGWDKAGCVHLCGMAGNTV